MVRCREHGVKRSVKEIQKEIAMKTKLRSVVFGLTILTASMVLPSARADEWNKETVLTFSAPVAIPGRILPAGKYIFKLADNEHDRDIVQVFTEDDGELLATILAIPAYRLEPTPEMKITFAERPAGSPEAIHQWFYPGETTGVEFVYKADADDESQAAAQLPDPPELDAEAVEDDAAPFVVVVVPLPDPEEMETSAVPGAAGLVVAPALAEVAEPLPGSR
jgi:hypothetical protein